MPRAYYAKSIMIRSAHSAKATASLGPCGRSTRRVTLVARTPTTSRACYYVPAERRMPLRPVRASECALEAGYLGFKPLRRLITVCAWCGKIRNSSGGWQRVPAGFQSEAEAQLTHGICPACAENQYAGYQALTSVMNGAGHAVERTSRRHLSHEKPQGFSSYEANN